MGPLILNQPEIRERVEQWEQKSFHDKEAWRNLSRFRKALGTIGQGRLPQLTVEKQEAIIEKCEKWQPICQELKKDFGRLRNEPAYTNEFNRKEARGGLAEKFSISVADVNAIEGYLYPDEELSRQGYKATPWNAMLRMMALKHSGSSLAVGIKTVEAIYLRWLNVHPEKKKRQRKSVTTLSADERTP